MTRVASGDPRMWIDIGADNRDADPLGPWMCFAECLADMRSVVATGDSAALMEKLSAAASGHGDPCQ